MFLAVAVLAVAAPHFVIDERVGEAGALEAVAEKQWTAMTELTARASGVPVSPATVTVHIAPGRDLRPGEAGSSRYGRVELRTTGAVTPELTTALRHELGHQFLWATCPAATEDRLFHEAFALIVSGERWDEAYVTTPQAVRVLAEASSLDAPKSRAALARLIQESLTDRLEMPGPMAQRLATCSGNVPWRPLQVAELAPAERAYGDAFVVIDRYSGELVTFEGAVDLPMPFGSVMKPFIVAGTPGAPLLAPVRGDSNWECGDAMPAQVDASHALARSCNGYFLAWGVTSPVAAQFGTYGALLTALGLPRLPNAMSEAIGITPALALTPRAVAEAYRALALSAPGSITALEDTSRIGTLAGLAVDDATSGAKSQRRAYKTGTVRDPQSRPLVGWLVQVTPSYVAVSTVAGKQPRDFAVRASQRLTTIARRIEDRRVDVQVFGLVGASHVIVQCRGVPVRGAEVVKAREPISLSSVLADNALACLGAPWLVQIIGAAAEEPRTYAGTFGFAGLPRATSSNDDTASRRALRARRGSDVIFTTSLGAYVAGVTHEEGGTIHGATREALVRVIAHNAFEPRHPGRPICDTTHCQVFKGTKHLDDDDARSLYRGMPYLGWLQFELGGDAPWEKSVPIREIDRVLGPNAVELHLTPDYVSYIRTLDDPADERVRVRCEVLRNALHLLSCPTSVTPGRDAWLFKGQGAGHAEGLNLLRAQQTNQSADSILQKAYGTAPHR